MAPTVSAPLNAEPANPEERKDHNLPPKSYADAVEEEPPAADTNGSKPTNGVNGTNGTGSAKHMAPVLRIVDTGAPDAKGKEETQEKKGEKPSMERQESKLEYSATVCF